MKRSASFALVLIAATSAAGANTYRVDNTNNTGYRSLRWAIARANTNPGADRIIFNNSLLGAIIKPTNPLPAVTDAGTTIDGDINNDGRPDIALDGSLLGGANGLEIEADNCVVEGLSIIRFPSVGLVLRSVTGCAVRACHLGVNAAGTSARPNSAAQLVLNGSNNNTIGRTGQRNLISPGTTGSSGPDGVLLQNASGNLVRHNYFNLNSSGDAALGSGAWSLRIVSTTGPAVGNVIRGNRFARAYYGVTLENGDATTIWGNWFGLGADGSTSLPMTGDCVWLDAGSSNNRIGGTTAAARNVFVGGKDAQGIRLSGTGIEGNRIQGNYFGTSADGTRRRNLRRGVVSYGGPGAQLIGGPTAAGGNYFALRSALETTGIYVADAAPGTRIENNVFGRLPSGADAGTTGAHIDITGASTVRVLNNLIARNTYGLLIRYCPAPKGVTVCGNTFRNCTFGVTLNASSSANLGNLGNAATNDDGGNRFRPTNTVHIWNQSPNRIRAEGNDFGTASKAAIDAKITDRLDDPTTGRVDFDPLLGGVHPTGGTEGLLALTGTAAIPTVGGAEIVYSLSAPAEVTIEVLNIAGRPVASIVQDRVSEAGLQRVLWNGRSSTGTAAPSGSYLVRIAAHSADGGQANAIMPLRLLSH